MIGAKVLTSPRQNSGQRCAEQRDGARELHGGLYSQITGGSKLDPVAAVH